MLSTSGQKKMVVSSTVEDITKEITMKGVEEQIQEEEKKQQIVRERTIGKGQQTSISKESIGFHYDVAEPATTPVQFNEGVNENSVHFKPFRHPMGFYLKQYKLKMGNRTLQVRQFLRNRRRSIKYRRLIKAARSSWGVCT